MQIQPKQRKEFSLRGAEPFAFEIDGRSYEIIDSLPIAELEIREANVTSAVYQIDGRYARVTVVGESEVRPGAGIFDGWYTAVWISAEAADHLRQTWGLLR